MGGRFLTQPHRRGVEVCENFYHFFKKNTPPLLSTVFEPFLIFFLGVFCCGPAPVKGIKNRRTDLIYDIPFVCAAVNADVHTIILSKQDQVVGFSKDTEKVGSLICTKAIGYPRVQEITGDYKRIKSRSLKQKHINTFPTK